jgi:hypothetical protein
MKVAADKGVSKLSRLTPLQVTNPNLTARQQRALERKLAAEIVAEMIKDWRDI